MIGRSGGGFAAGIIVAAVLLFAGVYVCHLLYPLPSGLNISNSPAFLKYMAALPLEIRAGLVATWFVAAIGGGFVARRLGGSLSVLALGALLIAAAAGAVFQMQLPMWLGIDQIGAALAGALLSIRPKA